MPELGSYGSVRGARGNSRPYRESKRDARYVRLSLDLNMISRRGEQSKGQFPDMVAVLTRKPHAMGSELVSPRMHRAIVHAYR